MIEEDEVCIITSFDDWLDRMMRLGSISIERVDAVRTGVSKEVDYLKKTFDHIAKIDSELCYLYYEKLKLQKEIKKIKSKRKK